MEFCHHQLARSTAVAWGSLVVMVLVAGSARADRIILRSLKFIDEPVKRFDEDGVTFESGSSVSWDEIERGTVADDMQKAFDAMLEKLGDPLFRIRQGLNIGDYENILPHAEKVYPLYAERDSPTAYMVMQGLMWARIKAGKRAAAVEPYLRALEYLRRHEGKADALPGNRRLDVDRGAGITSELLPVWFDAEAAQTAMPGVKAAGLAMTNPRPEGVYVTYAMLALTAGETAEANRFLGAVGETAPDVVKQMRNVALAQREIQSGAPGPAVAQLEDSLDGMLPVTRPAAIYWVGMAKTLQTDNAARQAGVLQLCYLPALYGNDYPELAAAGLYRAMNVLDELGDTSGSIALRKELLRNYEGTIHADKVKAGSAASK